MTDNPAGWQADPTGRHEHRYWDGSQWTEHVSNGGVASTDAYEQAAEASTAADAADAAGSPADAAPVDPTTETPSWGDPTTAQPAAPSDPTAAWPTTPAPPAPPVPPVPPAPTYGAAGPIGPEPSSDKGSKRGLLIGGGILAVVIVAVIAFLALGGDDDDKSDIRAELASEIEDSSDGALTSDQADCVAGFLIEEIGEDKMAGVDFDADEPPEEIADEIIPAMMGAVAECEVSLGDLSGDGGDDDADKPSDDGDDSSEGDGTYGSDPELDELWDACEDGDWEACDDLYMQSDVGSEYEEFGDTCGNRNEPAGLCVNEQGDGGGTDEGITDLGDVEFDGDMESMLADIYEESLGLEREKAECLAGRLADAMSSGEVAEEDMMSDIMDYIDECGISMEELSN